jgi:transketolase
MSNLDEHRLREIGQQLRVDSVRCSEAASSGHLTSSMSAADLIAVLMTRHLRYDFGNPADPANDHLIFSKGHASPLYYAMLKMAGAVTGAGVAAGSLGQGLPTGVGIALTGRDLDHLPYRVWVLCGDGELAEGSIWEAAEQAGYSQLSNLTAIVDVNRLGQRGPTRHGRDTGAYAERFAAFGWHTIQIDGHDIAAIDRALAEAAGPAGAQPTVILARTRKGRGVAAAEGRDGAHGKPLPDPEAAIRELGGERRLSVQVQPPPSHLAPARSPARPNPLPSYTPGTMTDTRTAFGEALAALGDLRPDLVVLDGEASGSAHTQEFAARHPERFFECYIAEQQMIATAVGMHLRGWVPYVSASAAFLSRAYDLIRMAAISRASIRLVGTHAGVATGQDGPSRMTLEDLAVLRAVRGSTILYPCDANQAVLLTAALADVSGVSYLRASCGATPVIYGPDEEFPIGGSRVIRRAPDDQVTLVAAGVSVHEALAAADLLADDGISARVIDAYSIRPIDALTLRRAAAETERIITVEDHWPEGGLGDAVLDALAGTPALVRKLAVREMPASGTAAEQLQLAGIDMLSIASAAAELLERIGRPGGG